MKIKIKSFGCPVNINEAGIIAGSLEKEGHKIVDKNEDLEIISICTVKGNSKSLREIRKANKNLIVTGCIPKDLVEEILKINPKANIIDTHNINKIPKLIKEKKIILGDSQEKRLNLDKKRKNNLINIVPISKGCKGCCSYCSVKLIKGELRSYDSEEIIRDIKKGIKEGCKEVWLTSQDTIVYGLDKEKKSKLPELISEICKIKGNFFVRVGMMNPSYIKPVLKELIEVFKNEKVYKFLHVPLQSGSDRILKEMRRNYSSNEFIDIVSEFRKEFPLISISTDVIVGFPGETDEDFKETLEVIRKIKPDIVNISKYVPRKGTEAYSKKQVVSNKVKERSLKLKRLFDSIALENNQKWVGWKGNILINEKGKNHTFIGRNLFYKPIIVKKGVVGEDKIVLIKRVTKYDLRE